jgi:hypothetical protein
LWLLVGVEVAVMRLAVVVLVASVQEQALQ